MTTTIMRYSKVGDEWLRQTYAANPVQRMLDSAGQPNGNITTGPVRLMFPEIFEPKKKDDGSKGKYGATPLFLPFSDLTIFYEEIYKLAAQHFRHCYDAQSGTYIGMHTPFHDQRDKMLKYEGFTPGAFYMNVTSQYAPSVYDVAGNPIIDPKRVYPGVWGILNVNPYVYGINPRRAKQGIGFGLNAVMIIGDDQNVGGGGQGDPKQQFKGVNVTPPAVAPGAAFGQHVAGPAPSVTDPGFAGGYVPPSFGQPAPAYQPPAPQTGAWQPPAPAEDTSWMG